MHCIKLLGDRLSARSFDSQVNEIHARSSPQQIYGIRSTTYPSYALNLAQLGALCISNLYATKPSLTQELKGILLGDKGYLSKAKAEALAARGLKILTPSRRNMKNKPIQTEEENNYFAEED